MWTLVRQAAKRQGDIIEIGVWRGGTAALIGRASTLFAANRTLYLCNTFACVVKPSVRDHHYRGREHDDTSVDLVRGALSLLGVSDAALLEGVFPEETARRLPSDVSFALAHIDVDTYESARDCFEYLWPRMAIGGVIVFDDYGFQACSGVTTFCNEIAMLADCMFVHNLNGHAVMIKTEE